MRIAQQNVRFIITLIFLFFYFGNDAIAEPQSSIDKINFVSDGPMCRGYDGTSHDIKPKGYRASEDLISLANILKIEYMKNLGVTLKPLLYHSLLFQKSPDHFQIWKNASISKCKYPGNNNVPKLLKNMLDVSFTEISPPPGNNLNLSKQLLLKRLTIALLEIGRIRHLLQSLDKNDELRRANPSGKHQLTEILALIYQYYPQLQMIDEYGHTHDSLAGLLEDRVSQALRLQLNMLRLGSYTSHPDVLEKLFSNYGKKRTSHASPYSPTIKPVGNLFSVSYQNIYTYIYDAIWLESNPQHYQDAWLENQLEHMTIESTRQVTELFGDLCLKKPCEVFNISPSTLQEFIPTAVKKNSESGDPLFGEICGCDLRKEHRTIPRWLSRANMGAGFGLIGTCAASTIASFAGLTIPFSGPIAVGSCGVLVAASPGTLWISHREHSDNKKNLELLKEVARTNTTGIVDVRKTFDTVKDLEKIQSETFLSGLTYYTEIGGIGAFFMRGFKVLMDIPAIGNSVAKGVRAIHTPSIAFGSRISDTLASLRAKTIQEYKFAIGERHDNFDNGSPLLNGFSKALYSTGKKLLYFNGGSRLPRYFKVGKRADRYEVYRVIKAIRELEEGVAPTDEQLELIRKGIGLIDDYKDYERQVGKLVDEGYEAMYQAEDLAPYVNGGGKALSPTDFLPRTAPDGSIQRGHPVSYRVVEDGEIREVTESFTDYIKLKQKADHAHARYQKIFSLSYRDELIFNSEILDRIYSQAELYHILRYLRDAAEEMVELNRLNSSTAKGIHPKVIEILDQSKNALTNLRVLPRSDALYRFQYKQMMAELKPAIKSAPIKLPAWLLRKVRGNNVNGINSERIVSQFEDLTNFQKASAARQWVQAGIRGLAIFSVVSSSVTAFVTLSPDAFFFTMRLRRAFDSLVRNVRGFTDAEWTCATENRAWTWEEGSCALERLGQYMIEYYIRAKQDPTYDYTLDAQYWIDIQEYQLHLNSLAANWSMFGRDSFYQAQSRFITTAYTEAGDAQLVAALEEAFPEFPELCGQVENVLFYSRLGQMEYVTETLEQLKVEYEFATNLFDDISVYITKVEEVRTIISQQAVLARGEAKLQKFMSEFLAEHSVEEDLAKKIGEKK